MAAVPKLHAWKQLHFAAFSLMKYKLACFLTFLARKPINTIANLFAFSPAPLNNIKDIFITQLFELGCLLLCDSCRLVEDSSEKREKGRGQDM